MEESQIFVKSKKILKLIFKNNIDLNKVNFETDTNMKKLKNSNLFKKRVSDKYRALYLVDNKNIYIFFFGNRDSIYNTKLRRKYDITNVKK